MSKFIDLYGGNYFRLKIAYSVLLNKQVKIKNIKDNSINPGLSDYEITFLKLVCKITNGSKIEIDETGTILKFFPGVITNNYGEEFEFDCGRERNVTYFLEGILPITLYGKEPLICTLKGITNDDRDISVDTFKESTCELIRKLVVGDEQAVKLEVKKRGLLPIGNGEVKFICPIITFINPIDWESEGKIKRIRGTAFTSKLGASITTRIVDACRGVFNNFIPDVWIYTENYKNKDEEMYNCFHKS